MSHIRFIDIPDNWNLKDVTLGLKQAMRWSNHELSQIKLIHFEQFNRKKDLRVTFHQLSLLEEVRKASLATRNHNMIKLSINGTIILCEIMNNLKERFTMSAVKKADVSTRSKTLIIKFFKKDSFNEILRKLNVVNTNKINYVSINQNTVFIMFKEKQECTTFARTMSNNFYSVKYAHTFLNLIKINQATNQNGNLLNDTSKVIKYNGAKRNNKQENDKPKDNPNVKKNSSKDKLYEKIEEISTKLQEVVNTQNVHNNMSSNNQNTLYPQMVYPSMPIYDRNIQLASIQYPQREMDLQFIQDLARLRNSLYPFRN